MARTRKSSEEIVEALVHDNDETPAAKRLRIAEREYNDAHRAFIEEIERRPPPSSEELLKQAEHELRNAQGNREWMQQRCAVAEAELRGFHHALEFLHASNMQPAQGISSGQTLNARTPANLADTITKHLSKGEK